MLRGFIRFLITLAVIAGIIFAGYLYVMNQIDTHTYVAIDEEASSDDYIVLNIVPGMRAAEVIDILYEEGLVRNSTIAGLLVRFRSWGAIQVGEYHVYAGMSLYDMFSMFQGGDIVEHEFVYVIIPEGSSIPAIATLFGEEFDIEPSELIELWSDESFLVELMNEFWFITDEVLNPDLYHPLEGYFYPIRHEIPVGVADRTTGEEEADGETTEDETTDVEVVEEEVDPREMTRAMLQMTERRLEDTGLRSEIEVSDLTFHEILSLAAIVEAETQESADMAGVAGVYWNRVNHPYHETNGLFGADPTVQYAYIAAGGEHQTLVTTEMTHGTISPFNTYLNPGPPPGPINSPSEHAIRAVLNPLDHGYFYFITDMFGCYIEEGSSEAYADPGRKIFARYLWEHEANTARYLQPSYDARRSVCNPDVQF